MSSGASSVVTARITPAVRDLGGFTVSRLLPSPHRRAIGPFVFFDQMGPAQFDAGKGIDVRAHPHIGLATLTYLYEGEIEHRDSLGSYQVIRPGEVNWMVAGRAITHSERTRAQTRQQPHPLSGIQTWVALPDEFEETEPLFEHFKNADLPTIEQEGIRIQLVVGAAFGVRAPVKTYSEMFFADALLAPAAIFQMPNDGQERGIFVAQGLVKIGGDEFRAGELLALESNKKVQVQAGADGARIALIGGEASESPRYLWWNFVASSKEKIDAAKQAWRDADWSNGRFQLPPDDCEEFIPLPEK